MPAAGAIRSLPGQRVPTWEEMVGLVRGKAGLYPEMKSPPLYTKRGLDMVNIFVASVKKLGLDRPDSLKSTPVIIQSFDEPSVRRVATELPTIPRVFLTEKDEDVSDARLRELATFATGIAPEKRVIARHPDMVARAHAARLDGDVVDVQGRREDAVRKRARRDVAVPLHVGNRRALHEQSGSVPATLVPYKLHHRGHGTNP